jgi:hypothetical protein
MTNRLALVIGVRDYTGGVFPALPVVEYDIEAMQSCLAASGYEVKPFGLDPGERAGSTIYQHLQSFCRTAPRGSTLFIYFSGHGLHHRGKDYLVPADFNPLNAEDYERLLIPIDITAAVENSQAQAVVFFIDACRIGVDLDNIGVKSSAFSSWGKEKLRQVSRHKLAIVLGCSPGQVCHYVSGDVPFSLFTKALVSTLSPDHPARSLKEVIDATQAELARLITLHGKSVQKICVLSEHSPGEPGAGDLIICDAKGAGALTDYLSDPWTRSVYQSFLWTGIKGGPGTLSERLQQHVVATVAACRRQFERGRGALGEDPWIDEAFASRVLDRLGFLIEHSDPRIELSPSERALMVIAPFLREAVLGHGLLLAAAARPLELEPIAPGKCDAPYRGKLEQIYESSPQLIRKAVKLLELNRTEDRNAVVMWLVHRAMLRDPEIWLPAPNGLFPQELLEFVEPVRPCDGMNSEDLAFAQSLAPGVLIELAKCICSDPGRLERNDTSQPLQFTVQVAPATPYEQTVRARALGYLLSLAGWLAIDPRLLSDVVVDHVGLSNPLTPDTVLRYARLASWHAVGRTRSLHLTCEHPAADLAFREYTSRAANVLASCSRAASEQGAALAILNGLPTRLTADGIKPAESDGIAVYQLPHLRFELAQDEIRELLMGEQLYGSPVYAIRELYQNALDALRYRQARFAYLHRTGPAPELWQGRIVFRQDITEDGRPYIECEDNGIGMGLRELSECFARAGKRFTTLPEFIEERSQWLRCDPPIHLYPNSQFGVGVFSYFMLADEIEIETCRLDRDGRAGQKLDVHVSSSGSLFRVRSLGLGQDAGTKIRLFLNKTTYTPYRPFVSDWQKAVSCEETLAQLVGVAEFPLIVQQNGKRRHFKPGLLNKKVSTDWMGVQRAQTSGHPDLWWSVKGIPLADGIAIMDVDDPYYYGRDWQLPLIVNFHGAQYPRLSVSRTKLLTYDDEWLDSLLDKHWKSATSLSFLSVEWLLKFHKNKPRIAKRIVGFLWKNNTALPVREDGKDARPIQELGWWPGDLALLELTARLDDDDIGRLHGLEPTWWIPHRIRFLENLGLNFDNEIWEHIEIPGRVSPVIPVPGDEVVLREDLFDAEGTDGRRPFVDAFQLACLSARTEIPVDKLLGRLARYSPLGIDLPSLTLCDALRSTPLSVWDLRPLSSKFDGKPPYHPLITGRRLISASAALKESFQALRGRLCRLAPLGVTIPEFDAETLGAVIASPLEAKIVADIADMWEHSAPCISSFVRAAVRNGVSLIEAYHSYSNFVPLVPPLPAWNLDILANTTPEKSDLLLLSQHLNGDSPWITEVSAEHISAATKELQMSPPTAIAALRKYTPFGLTLSVDANSRRATRKKKSKPRK